MESNRGLGLPDFEEPALAAAVEKLSVDQINNLPFGAIRLDASGQAVFYNDTQRRQSGYRKEVVGHKFFTEIAPCLDKPSFRGRIDQAMAAGVLDISFTYIGMMPSGDAELEVRIQSATGGGCWIFMKRTD